MRRPNPPKVWAIREELKLYEYDDRGNVIERRLGQVIAPGRAPTPTKELPVIEQEPGDYTTTSAEYDRWSGGTPPLEVDDLDPTQHPLDEQSGAAGVWLLNNMMSNPPR